MITEKQITIKKRTKINIKIKFYKKIKEKRYIAIKKLRTKFNIINK
jgi:hypothetical protein